MKILFAFALFFLFARTAMAEEVKVVPWPPNCENQPKNQCTGWMVGFQGFIDKDGKTHRFVTREIQKKDAATPADAEKFARNILNSPNPQGAPK